MTRPARPCSYCSSPCPEDRISQAARRVTVLAQALRALADNPDTAGAHLDDIAEAAVELGYDLRDAVDALVGGERTGADATEGSGAEVQS